MSTKICMALIFTNLLFVISTYAQDLTVPKHGFSIVTDEVVTIEKGTLKKVDVRLLKAKALINKNVLMEISSPLPEGVAIDFESDLARSEVVRARIAVSPSANAGSYFVVVSGTLQYKTKGRALKLIVTDAATGM